jgi:hypothetical protein
MKKKKKKIKTCSNFPFVLQVPKKENDNLINIYTIRDYKSYINYKIITLHLFMI